MSRERSSQPRGAVPQPLADWLSAHTGTPGPWRGRALDGADRSVLLTAPTARYVLRRPGAPSTDHLDREHRVLTALAGTEVPAPAPGAVCLDPDVPLAPFLVTGHVADAVAVTDPLPPGYRAADLGTVADQLVDALAAVHRLDWRAAGLGGLDGPERALERQVGWWYGQWEKIACRPLPAMDRLADWLDRNRPADRPPALLHGDFHLGNCLYAVEAPTLRAVVGWELATIGDPLLDLGLLLALWGERLLDPPALGSVQGVSRLPGAPPREHLLRRYEAVTGTAVGHPGYYQCLALFRLAAVVEATYARYRAGELDTADAADVSDAAALEYDVPALLAEAEGIAEE